MSKAQVMANQGEISGDQQVLINKVKKEAKNNPLTMEEHKRAIKKLMSYYQEGLW